MNVIVLDGPDGSGKTTLANLLVSKGFSLIHFGVPPVEARKNENSIFHFYLDPIYHHLMIPRSTVVPKLVLDRSHLAEPIYGNVMRDGTVMTHRVEMLLERYLEAVDAQIVICLPPYRTALNNWIKRKEMQYVKDAPEFRRIYQGYAKLLFNRKRNRNFVWFDYTRHKVDSFANSLMNVNGDPLPYGVVGSQRPRFLFVGERTSDENGQNPTIDLPFLSPNNCSGWLFDRMKEACFQEHEVAFTNVFINRYFETGEERQDVKALVERFKLTGLSTVIALGHTAAKVLNEQGIRYIPITHPQFAKRFKTKEKGAYVHLLKEIRRGAR